VSVTSKLDILIEARNNASPALRQVGLDLRSLDNAAATAAGGLGSLAKVAGVAGLVALSVQAVNAGVELARVGAMADQVRTAFNNMAESAGASGDEILEALRRASRGSVSDMNLMLSANRAMLFGVADNVEEFTQLMQIAEARGKGMGISTTQAFDNIITGIGRLSPLILDNLGIVYQGEQLFADYAQSIGMTAEQLSDAEKRQALLNMVVAQSADLVAKNNAAGENMVDQFERMDAAIQSAKEALGELFAPAMAAIARQIADAVTMATDAITDAQKATAEGDLFAIGDSITGYLAALEKAEQRMRDSALLGNVPGMQDAANQIEMLRAGLRTLAEDYNAAAAITGAPLLNVGALARGEMATLDAANAVNDVGAEAELAKAKVAELMGALLRLDSAQRSAASSVEQRLFDTALRRSGGDYLAAMSGGAAASMAIIERANTLMLQGNRDLEFRDQVIIPSLIRQEQESLRLMEQAAPATHAIGDAAAKVNQEFESLKGKVAGVLSGALDVGVGVGPADFLPREDAINEQARRLADIMVNGFTGQDWVGAFAEGAPDIYKMLTESGDPKAAAAQLLLDFQDGLVPDLIDKDKAKDLVRRMLLGEANMAELAQEIAAELSGEMGVSSAQALVAAQGALGVDGAVQMEPAGADAAVGFSDGFDAALQDLGQRAAATMEKSVASDAVVKQMTNAGHSAGTVWGDGFLAAVGQNIPQALLDILTLRVLPMVQGGLTAQASASAAQ
jgi:hypothetical protein